MASKAAPAKKPPAKKCDHKWDESAHRCFKCGRKEPRDKKNGTLAPIGKSKSKEKETPPPPSPAVVDPPAAPAPAPSSPLRSAQPIPEGATRVCSAGRPHLAYGFSTPATGTFTILPGSHASLDERTSCPPSTRAHRATLLQQGDLLRQSTPQGDALVFQKAVEFSSKSTAASIVQGGSANGVTAWKPLPAVQA